MGTFSSILFLVIALIFLSMSAIQLYRLTKDSKQLDEMIERHHKDFMEYINQKQSDNEK